MGDLFNSVKNELFKTIEVPLIRIRVGTDYATELNAIFNQLNLTGIVAQQTTAKKRHSNIKMLERPQINLDNLLSRAYIISNRETRSSSPNH